MIVDNFNMRDHVVLGIEEVRVIVILVETAEHTLHFGRAGNTYKVHTKRLVVQLEILGKSAVHHLFHLQT